MKIKYMAFALAVLMSVILAGCTSSSGTSDNPATATPSTSTVSVTPTPTAKATGNVGLSRSNPAAIGATVTYTRDLFNLDLSNFMDPKSLGKYKAEITVLEVIRGKDAQAMIDKDNPYITNNYDSGTEPLVAHLKWNIIKTPSIDTPVSCSILRVGIDSKGPIEASTLLAGPDPDFYRSDLYEGYTSDGWVAFGVDKTDSAPLLKFDSNVKDGSAIWFKLA